MYRYILYSFLFKINSYIHEIEFSLFFVHRHRVNIYTIHWHVEHFIIVFFLHHILNSSFWIMQRTNYSKDYILTIIQPRKLSILNPKNFHWVRYRVRYAEFKISFFRSGKGFSNPHQVYARFFCRSF